jgi:hypothetical protein
LVKEKVSFYKAVDATINEPGGLSVRQLREFKRYRTGRLNRPARG